jgi:hypothetical protein
VGRVFHLDQIAEAHRCMEDNTAGGKIVVLTSQRTCCIFRLVRLVAIPGYFPPLSGGPKSLPSPAQLLGATSSKMT